MASATRNSKPNNQRAKSRVNSRALDRDAFFEAMPATNNRFAYRDDYPTFDHNADHEELETKAKITAMVTLSFVALTIVLLSLLLFGAVSLLGR